MVNQCGILFLGPRGSDEDRIAALRSLGFRVHESDDLLTPDELASFHAVVVRPRCAGSLPMLGARYRARPHFGRRLLIALVEDGVSERVQREARMSGFDGTVPSNCSPRDLAATVLRLLRPFPEHRCVLRAPRGRRRAA